jgi:hypothetical protein
MNALGFLASIQVSKRGEWILAIAGRQLPTFASLFGKTITPAGRKGQQFISRPSSYYVPIRRIKQTTYTGYVYNLDVGEPHSYCVQELAVHNCEAQSCGIPVIVTDHSSMSELCGSGWRVPPLRLTPSLIGGRFAEADVAGIDHALEECYRRSDVTVRGMARIAREFALGYDWPIVMRDYWRPFLEEIDAGRLSLTRQIHDERHPRAPLPPVAGNGKVSEFDQHFAWQGWGILTKYPEYAREKAERRAAAAPPEPASVSESATPEQDQEAVAPV